MRTNPKQRKVIVSSLVKILCELCELCQDIKNQAPMKRILGFLLISDTGVDIEGHVMDWICDHLEAEELSIIQYMLNQSITLTALSEMSADKQFNLNICYLVLAVTQLAVKDEVGESAVRMRCVHGVYSLQDDLIKFGTVMLKVCDFYHGPDKRRYIGRFNTILDRAVRGCNTIEIMGYFNRG